MLLHAMSEALVRECEVDDDLKRRFSDETLNKLDALLRLAWNLFVCLALAFVVSYWTIALVHSYSSSQFFSDDHAACLTPD